jgi:hypothetical protein
MTSTMSIPATSAARPQPEVLGASHMLVSFVITEGVVWHCQRVRSKVVPREVTCQRNENREILFREPPHAVYRGTSTPTGPLSVLACLERRMGCEESVM